jgi:hypothetical protein
MAKLCCRNFFQNANVESRERRNTIEEALRCYEAERRPIMNAVTLRNREFGPAVVMELAKQRAPDGFSRIEDVIPRRELEEISAAYKAEAGFESATLNQRPSLAVPRSPLFSD